MIPLDTPFQPPNCPPNQYHVIVKSPNWDGKMHRIDDLKSFFEDSRLKVPNSSVTKPDENI